MSSTRRSILAVMAAVLALIASACGSSNPLGGGEISGDLKSIKVGSADFTESKIIAELYAQALEANGFRRGAHRPVEGATRRPVHPLPVAGRGQRHPRGHRSDRQPAEREVDSGS